MKERKKKKRKEEARLNKFMLIRTSNIHMGKRERSRQVTYIIKKHIQHQTNSD